MNSSQLARELAERGGMSIRDARDTISDLEDIIIQAVKSGESVAIGRVVKVNVNATPARPAGQYPDPFTKELVDRPARKASISVRASALKRVKDVAPKPSTKLGKDLLAEAKRRADERAANAA